MWYVDRTKGTICSTLFSPRYMFYFSVLFTKCYLTLLSWIPSYLQWNWKGKAKSVKAKFASTHIASPRKSSLLKLSFSIILRASSEALSETVKRKVSFHCGLDPAPDIHNKVVINNPPRETMANKQICNEVSQKRTFLHSALMLLCPVTENHIRIYVGCSIQNKKNQAVRGWSWPVSIVK